MLSLAEIQTLKEALDELPDGSQVHPRLEAITIKYQQAIAKIVGKAKPISREELTELRLDRGLSISEIRQELRKRHKVSYGHSTIEKAVRAYDLVGKGRQAEEHTKRVERAKPVSLKEMENMQ